MSIWGKITGQKKYQHIRYDRYVDANTPAIMAPFTPVSTIRVEEVNLGLENAGNLAATCYVWFRDALTKRQIGNQIRLSLAAGSGVSVHTLSGFSAALFRGRDYELVVDFARPDINSYTAPQSSTSHYSVAIRAYGIKGAAVGPAWKFRLGDGEVVMAGREGYQATGAAWRTFDVREAPAGDGLVTFVDVVPAGTSMQVELWYTNNPTLAAAPGTTGWTYHGIVQSGDTIPPARYWRAKISYTSTAGNDDTPELSAISIIYYRDPVLIGTHVQAVPLTSGGTTAQSAPGLSRIGTASAALSPQLKQQMVGRMTCELAPEPEADYLASVPLRGHRAQIRVGYNGVPDTIGLYDGIVRDMAWHGNRWALTMDDIISITDAKAPNRRWPTWDAATAYNPGDIVAYNGKGWLALVGSKVVTPGSDPNTWQEYGAVWKELDYTPASNNGANWHLADIAYDILSNAINLPGERIDRASIDAVKALRPAVVSTGARITHPVSGRKLLEEIAWLLQAQWIERDGQIALLPDPDPATVAPVETITPDDIAEGLQYRRGWADEKNECLILTGLPAGSDAGQPGNYSDGIVATDAAAVHDADAVLPHVFHDRWNVPQSELTRIATDFVSSWAGGRAVVRAMVSMRLMALEPGDVIRLQSGQLPGGRSEMLMMVTRVDLDWQRQALRMDFLEV